jgi:LysM repeat protein
MTSNNSVLQGFSSPFTSTTNPSGASLTRRGRLARTLFVASLTVVLVAGFAAKSGAGDQVVAPTSYVTVVVPQGATLWSVASAYSTGDVQAKVEAIREVNNLKGYDVAAGQKLRVPTA